MKKISPLPGFKYVTLCLKSIISFFSRSSKFHYIFASFLATPKLIITKLLFDFHGVTLQFLFQCHVSPCDRRSCSASQAKFDFFITQKHFSQLIHNRLTWDQKIYTDRFHCIAHRLQI